jgi:transposase InsO family protein
LIEERIVNLKRKHPNWGKKRIAQQIWKENNWEQNVAIDTVKNVLNRHGMWKEDGKRKEKKKNKGITAQEPNKTINIDLCFIPSEEIHQIDFSPFFQLIDDNSKNYSDVCEKSVNKAEKDGLDIFSQENKKYDEKMADYVVMRRNKQDKKDNDKKKDILAMEKKATAKQDEEELRTWRRNIRTERERENEEWKKYREDRINIIKKVKGISKEKKKEHRDEKKRNDLEWKRKKAKRKELLTKRKKEDEEWRCKRKEISEQKNVFIISLVAILVVVDNCTRKCFGLPVFIKGRHVSADDVVKALENLLPPELKYIISDNGKQFVAEAFQKFCTNKGITHIRITPHRPATNGIAERFVRRLKEMLNERTWINVEELLIILEQIVKEYNDSPHQGLNGLSPNEFERRLVV